MGSSEGTVRGTLSILTTTLLCLLFTPTTTLALATTNHDDNVGVSSRARSSSSSSTSSSVCSLPQEDSTISRLVFFDQFFTAPSLITTTTTTTAASRRRSTGRGASAVSVDWLHSTIVNSIAEADEFRDITKGKGKVTLSMEAYLIIPPLKAAAELARISTTTLTPTASSSFNTLWKEGIIKDLPKILELVNEGTVQALLIGEALIWRGLLPQGWTTLEEVANFLVTVVTVASSSSSLISLRYSEHETVLGFGVDSEGTKVKCETPNQKLPLAIKYYTLVGPATSADQTIASLSGGAQSSSITTRDQIYHHSLPASKQRRQPQQENSIFYYHHVLAARLHKPGLEHFVVPILPEVVAPSSSTHSSLTTTISQYEDCLTDTSKRYTLACYISWASAEPIVAGFVNFPVFSEDAARQIIAAKAAAIHRRPFRVKRSREDDDEIDEDHHRNEDQTHRTQIGIVGQQKKNKGAPLRAASSSECAVDILSLVLDKKRRFD